MNLQQNFSRQSHVTVQTFFEFIFIEIWPWMAQDNVYLIIRQDPGCFLDDRTFIQPIMGDSMLVPQQ
jgi:hypothetical protein